MNRAFIVLTATLLGACASGAYRADGGSGGGVVTSDPRYGCIQQVRAEGLELRSISAPTYSPSDFGPPVETFFILRVGEDGGPSRFARCTHYTSSGRSVITAQP